MLIEITQELVEQAGELAEAFALRGYDSIHLAAALLVMRRTGEQITFACFDNRLNKAAALLGILGRQRPAGQNQEVRHPLDPDG